MPCQDYGDTRSGSKWRDEQRIRELEERNDMLARIACKAMQYLEDQEIEDFLLIKDPEVREWWTEHKAADIAAAAQEVERLKKARAQTRRKQTKLQKDEDELNRQIEEAEAEFNRRRGVRA